jgi:hypothetical protein
MAGRRGRGKAGRLSCVGCWPRRAWRRCLAGQGLTLTRLDLWRQR